MVGLRRRLRHPVVRAMKLLNSMDSETDNKALLTEVRNAIDKALKEV